MTCTTYPDGLTICRTGATRVIATETEARWCFGCRKRVEYVYELKATVEPSYYEPHWVARCPTCKVDASHFGDARW